MSVKYRVDLSSEERHGLEKILRSGHASALKHRHARILLLADESHIGATDVQIAQSVGVGTATVERVRKHFVLHGLDSCLSRKSPDRHYVRKLDGKGEARLIALACSPAPEGHARWSLRLLADKLVELEIVDEISHEAVRNTLKKTK